MKRTKAKPKTKAPKVEAWAVVDCTGFFSVFPSNSRAAVEKEWAAQRADFDMGPGAENLVRLVPDDPLARLKEDVVRAAAEWARCGAAAFPNGRTANALAAAVERLERKR